MWLHNLIPQSPIATHRQCDNWFIFVGLFQLPACGIFCFINFYFCPWAFLRGFKSFLWYRAYATWWFLLYDFFFVHLQFTRSCHGWMITENSKKKSFKLIWLTRPSDSYQPTVYCRHTVGLVLIIFQHYQNKKKKLLPTLIEWCAIFYSSMT